MLILDEHASHVSTKTVEYCVGKKIILLCLPAHTTHLLKKHVHRITRLDAGYAIDKVNFLKMVRLARYDAITSTKILKAWQAVVLSSYNPRLILQQFPPPASENQAAEYYQVTIRPTTPPEAVFRCEGPNGSREAILTSGNG